MSRKQTDELKKLLADDIAFYDGATQLYRQRAEALTFDLAARVKEFHQEKKGYLDLRNHRKHPWSGYIPSRCFRSYVELAG